MDKIGVHSLINRIHGECQALSEQDPSHRNKEWWKMFHKEMAVQFDEYPVDYYRVERHKKVARIKVPRSLASVNDSQGTKVQMEIQVTADEKGYWLWEYRRTTKDDNLIYRSLNGRSYEEMTAYIEEVREMAATARKSGDEEEAIRLEERAEELSITKLSRNTAGVASEQIEKKPAEIIKTLFDGEEIY